MEDPAENSVRPIDERVVSGAGWMIAMKFAIRGIGIVSMLILARLLVPEDFGIVAMAMSMAALVDLLRAFSFDIVLIQRKDARPEHFNSVWTLSILFAALMALVLFMLSNVAATYFKDSRLVPVIQVVAVSVFLGGFENVGTVLFRKHFEFHKEFVFMLTKKIVSFVVTVILAFWLRNYWALVFGIVASTLSGVVASYIMQPYRPRLDLSASREILSFSVWLQLNNVLFFVRNRSVDFVVGRIAGAKDLGVLTLATEISTILTSELVQPINRALFPGYAALSDSAESIKVAYLRVLSFIGLAIIPIGVGLSVTAVDLVPVALGNQWLDATFPIQLLSLYSVLVGLQGNNGLVFLAMGRPRILTFLTTVSVSLAVPLLIWFTMHKGVNGACVALLLAVILMLPVNYVFIRRELGVTLADIGQALWRPIASSIGMYGVCTAIQTGLPATSLAEHVTRLGLTVLAGVITFIVITFGLWIVSGRPSGAESYIKEQLSAIAR